MATSWIKRSLPRGLYGRAALILIAPIFILQLVVSVVFIQRHFEGVTGQMTRNVDLEVNHVLAEVQAAPDADAALARIAAFTRALRLQVQLPARSAFQDDRLYYDLSGRTLIEKLHDALPGLKAVDIASSSREVRMLIETRHGDMLVVADRRRVSASNPHQLLVLMIVTGLLMTAIAFVFLRNQLRPIRRLSRAAEAFGKGRSEPYRPAGASEVRLAGQAFLDMRARIERHIEQRTYMLSGVSHDLRTPLTRLKLALSLADPSPEHKDMQRDVEDMERMLEAFLAFARGEALDDLELCDPAEIFHAVVAKASGNVTTGEVAKGHSMQLRPLAVERALQNLLDNALNYGTKAHVWLEASPKSVRFVVEDDGPGIPRDRREAALQPFNRLDAARNQNKGGSVGLGLTIAADIARQHGGALRLSDSKALGGLQAELVLAR